MNTARTKQPIELPNDKTAALPIEQAPESEAVRNLRIALRYMAENQAEMAATIKALEIDNKNLKSQRWRGIAADAAAAERDKPVEEWLGLKAAAFDVGEPYQNVLKLCVLGKIVCEKPAGRWIVEMNSLRAQIAKQRGGYTKSARQVAADLFKRVRFP